MDREKMGRKAACVFAVTMAAVGGCSSSGSKTGGSTSPAAASSGPQRAIITCDSVLSETASTGAFFPDASAFTIHAGSWGNTPASMQSVPPGGALCGSLTDDSGGSSVSRGTYLVTNLWGQALEDFYRPLVPSGCTPSPLESNGSSTGFTCADGRLGQVLADSAFQYVTLLLNN